MRHALEPDHLAAVSTLVTGERSTFKAAWLGACWGFGHTLTLLAVGAVLVALRAEMPAAAADVFELGVAVMLIGLGLRAIYLAARQGPAGPCTSIITAGSCTAILVCLPTCTSGSGRWHGGLDRRCRVHRLAGSGALTALVLATLPSTTARLIYMALFGLGSTVGMAMLSGLLGWPLVRLARHHALARGVSLIVGLVSTVLGLLWGYPLVGRLLGA